MLALLGSKALNYHNFTREPKDIDLLGSYEDISSYVEKINNKDFGKIKSIHPSIKGKHLILNFELKNIEAEIISKNKHSELLFQLIKEDKNTQIIDGMYVPSINILYLLKMSHRYLKNSPHFLKTMKDIHYLRSIGADIQENHFGFFTMREKETYNYSHPKLNKDKKSFFIDNVDYKYDHDTIHLSMKNLEQPAYMYFKPPNSQVWCSKEMWDNCSEEIKLFAVLEETNVLAMERSQVLFENVKPEKSFNTALSKVCTSITSGWFREYAWENYDKVKSLYQTNYVEKFWKDVENGLIKSIEKNLLNKKMVY